MPADMEDLLAFGGIAFRRGGRYGGESDCKRKDQSDHGGIRAFEDMLQPLVAGRLTLASL
jgi:hypothetical protein